MSADSDQSKALDLSAIVQTAIKSGAVRPQVGKTVLLLWRDAEHLREWQERRAASSADVRIISLESQHLPMITLPDGVDRAAVAIVGAGLSRAADYNDTQLLYHATLAASPAAIHDQTV